MARLQITKPWWAAGFAFRKEVEALRWQRLFGAVFAFSSLITPFFMGTVIGATALLVGPSFLLLFSLHGRQLLEAEKHAEPGP